MIRMFCIVVCGLMTFSLIGCGSGGYPVSGIVKFADGETLARGQIHFDAKKGSTGFWADVEPNGEFTVVKTLQPTPGEYLVHIHAAEVKAQITTDPTTGQHTQTKPSLPLIHKKYLSAATSGLIVTVKPEPNKFEIVVEKPE